MTSKEAPKPAPARTSISQGLHRDVSKLDTTNWAWPHFQARELSCRCQTFCKGEYFHDPVFLDGLESLRAAMKAPIIINSGRRCARHNAAVGGARASMHMRSLAVDISLAGHDRAELARQAVKAGFQGIGFGRNFIHLDRGIQRAWSYAGAMPVWKDSLGFNPVSQFVRLMA
jgi:zinc D-Ala-D-Ala carboxypeptidase